MSFNARRKETPPYPPLQQKRKPFADITNDILDPRRSLRDELSGSNLSTDSTDTAAPPSPQAPTRRHSPRIFSAPVTAPTFGLGLGRPPLRQTISMRGASVPAATASRLTPFRDPTPDLTVDSSISHEPLVTSPATVEWEQRTTPKNKEAKQGLRELLSDDKEDVHTPAPSAAASGLDRPHAYPPVSSSKPQSPAVQHSSSAPTSLTTNLLRSKTHKVTQGQVVVLPSKSLLVDFREGERRKGRQGNEVLVISPDGEQIQVFSAPHLSTPCCLAEANATYSLEDLPDLYLKLYQQAVRVIEHVKKRVPELILYRSNCTCTLMANSPNADITIALDTPQSASTLSPGSSYNAAKVSSSATMLVRLSRKQRTVELSTSVSGSSKSGSTTGEWNKKVLFWNQDGDGPSGALIEKDWTSLGSREQDAIRALQDFLLVVKAVEAEERTPASIYSPGLPDKQAAEGLYRIDNDMPSLPNVTPFSRTEPAPPTAGQPLSSQRKKTIRFSPSIQELSAAAATGASSFLSTSKHLSELTIAPRPKLSKSSPRFNLPDDTMRKASSTVFDPIPDSHDEDYDPDSTPKTKGYRRRSPSLGLGSSYPKKAKSAVSMLVDNEIEWPSMRSPPGPLQTRFIPDVGWCVRYAPIRGGSGGDANVSGISAGGGGRYRIMFLDGVELEVDVDKERIEFVGQDGQVSSYSIREGHLKRAVGERMKVFEDFVSLFDDQDYEE